jgi:hypothetical protein
MNRFWVLGLVLTAGLGYLLVASAISERPRAQADDSYRKSTLGIVENDVVATLNSTYGSDEEWVINLFYTPSGGSEMGNGGTSATRTDGLTSSDTLRIEAPVSSFSSGATVKALFQTYDSSSSLLWSYERSVTIP